ncbi:MAG: hypothetical protein M3P30_06850 [Chloroflexota bacterium]|nr:hypothetical protein [Chloroflexota bacterium]
MSNALRRPVLRISLVILLTAIPFLALFCESSHTVTFKNESTRVILVSSGENPPHRVAPRNSTKVGILKFSGTREFVAKTEDGTVVFHRLLRWDDLRDMDWTVTIQSP